MSDDGWKKVGIGKSWNYKEEGVGSEVQGFFIDKETGVGENESMVYSLEQPDGTVVSVWGSTLLDARLKNVKLGEEVKIVYLGSEASEKRKGKFYHNFEVYHREAPMKKVEDNVNQDISVEEIPF